MMGEVVEQDYQPDAQNNRGDTLIRNRDVENFNLADGKYRQLVGKTAQPGPTQEFQDGNTQLR